MSERILPGLSTKVQVVAARCTGDSTENEFRKIYHTSLSLFLVLLLFSFLPHCFHFMVQMSGVVSTSAVGFVAFRPIRRCKRLFAFISCPGFHFLYGFSDPIWLINFCFFSGCVNSTAYDEIHRACNDIPVRIVSGFRSKTTYAGF